MDVLGLGLENYDPIGRWRDSEGGRAIEVSGSLPTGERFLSPAGMKKILLGSKGEFTRALCEKMLTYALGRPVGWGDRREIRRIQEALKEREYRFTTLIEEVAMSYPFRFRRPSGLKEPR
jgi:hypothetical protein